MDQNEYVQEIWQRVGHYQRERDRLRDKCNDMRRVLLNTADALKRCDRNTDILGEHRAYLDGLADACVHAAGEKEPYCDYR